jgi:hypothetical protein
MRRPVLFVPCTPRGARLGALYVKSEPFSSGTRLASVSATACTKLASIPGAFSKARNQPICRSSNRPRSSWYQPQGRPVLKACPDMHVGYGNCAFRVGPICVPLLFRPAGARPAPARNQRRLRAHEAKQQTRRLASRLRRVQGRGVGSRPRVYISSPQPGNWNQAHTAVYCWRRTDSRTSGGD